MGSEKGKKRERRRKEDQNDKKKNLETGLNKNQGRWGMEVKHRGWRFRVGHVIWSMTGEH